MSIGYPAGTPSRTTPTRRPWLSPRIVTTKWLPKLFGGLVYMHPHAARTPRSWMM
nr:hypothetical protein [Candidatus Sigynarchaeum springense]